MKAPYAGITFLSYKEMKAGDHFYREILGLPLIEDQGWAKVYRLHGSAHVGIVASNKDHGEHPLGVGALISMIS